MHRAHDVVVIGGGPAGYAAARTARAGVADVAIVDLGRSEGCVSSEAACRPKPCSVPTRAEIVTYPAESLLEKIGT